MKPTDRNKQLYRDMTEEPEKYSDQELEAMMDEIDQMPDVEEAWQLFSEKLKVKNQRSLALYTLHSSFKKSGRHSHQYHHDIGPCLCGNSLRAQP